MCLSDGIGWNGVRDDIPESWRDFRVALDGFAFY